MSNQYLWLCPICGTSHGKRITVKVGYIPYETKPYMETVDFDPDKPFGVILETLGKGKGKELVGYWQPGEDPDDYFPAVKQRFLSALKEWLDKGWIDKAEVLGTLNK